MAPPVLYHIEISHYNEKARWALDYKSVPHKRRAPAPMLHMAWAAAMTRGQGKTFPVLRLNGETIADSTRIIERLEREYPEPPLYPSDPAERRRALDLEEFFDEELGPHIRRFGFAAIVQDREAFAAAGAPSGGPLRTIFRATAPAGARALKVRYGIDEETAALGEQKTRAAVERVASELGAEDYLVGGRFSVADLTAAALLMPLVRPPEMQYTIDVPLPESLASFRDSLAAHPTFAWVHEMYRRHRGASAEIKG